MRLQVILHKSLFVSLTVGMAVLALSGCGKLADKAVSPDAHLKEAQKFINAGDFQSAYRQLNEALVLVPNDPEVHTNLGWLYIYTGEPDKANTELEKLEKIAPESVYTYHLRGGLYAHLNRPKDAVDNYKKALALDAKAIRHNPRVYFDMATSLSALQQYRQALAELQKGLALTPTGEAVERTNFQKAVCSAYYSLKDYPSAYKACSVAIASTDDPQEKEQINDFVESLKLSEEMDKGDNGASAAGKRIAPPAPGALAGPATD